jgi:hypothetical protein
MLHRRWISRSSPDPSRNTAFRDIETQLEQFAVNARRSLTAKAKRSRRFKPGVSLLVHPEPLD